MIDNGGDGYVAARHLKFLGMNPKIMIVKKPEKPLYKGLVKACESNDIEVIDYNEKSDFKDTFVEAINKGYDMVIDAIFGFSFQGPIRKPYDEILNGLKNLNIPIFSIDIPSGWDIEKGYC